MPNATFGPRRRGRAWIGRGAAFALALVLLWRGLAPAEPGFSSSVAPALIAEFVAKFGADAAKRIDQWQAMLRAARQARQSTSGASDREALTTVNDYFNRHMTFVDDLKHWGVDDYWATPAEFVASGGGDCEDYALAKYYALKELGVASSKLRITYVRALRLKVPHMILAYYAAPDAEPLVLDNLDPSILPASERPDLIPVYSFNDDDLWLSRGGVSTAAGSSSQIRLWRGFQDKLQQESEKR